MVKYQQRLPGRVCRLYPRSVVFKQYQPDYVTLVQVCPGIGAGVDYLSFSLRFFDYLSAISVLMLFICNFCKYIFENCQFHIVHVYKCALLLQTLLNNSTFSAFYSVMKMNRKKDICSIDQSLLDAKQTVHETYSFQVSSVLVNQNDIKYNYFILFLEICLNHRVQN